MIQILAHLPLADIHFSANVHQAFQFLISFVSFDFFPPYEYINVTFREVESWSPRFEWLGYDSIIFLEGLGSIFIFAVIVFILLLITLLFKLINISCPCRWLKEKFNVAKVWLTTVRFIDGTFFEIVVCISISLNFIPFTEEGDLLNDTDEFSINSAYIFALAIFAYVVFFVYFQLCKAKQMVEIRKV